MSATRTIVVEIVYRDDPESPKLLDVRAELSKVEAAWSRHLATPVDAWIIRDSFGQAADR